VTDTYAPSPQWDPWAKVRQEPIGLVVVVGCGRKKLSEPAPAREMYTGALFRSCMEAAESLRPDRLLILSAKYGLIDANRRVRPYDVRLGDPDAIQPERVERQALREMAWLAETVIVLASRAYVDLARTVWPDAVAPLEGARGIGEMRSILTEIRDRR
jgi:hypothetical protein